MDESISLVTLRVEFLHGGLPNVLSMVSVKMMLHLIFGEKHKFARFFVARDCFLLDIVPYFVIGVILDFGKSFPAVFAHERFLVDLVLDGFERGFGVHIFHVRFQTSYAVQGVGANGAFEIRFPFQKGVVML